MHSRKYVMGKIAINCHGHSDFVVMCVCAIMITFVHGHLYVILIPLKVSFQNMEKQEH